MVAKLKYPIARRDESVKDDYAGTTVSLFRKSSGSLKFYNILQCQILTSNVTKKRSFLSLNFILNADY